MPFVKKASGSPRPYDLTKQLGKEVAEVQYSLLVISNPRAPSLSVLPGPVSPSHWGF